MLKLLLIFFTTFAFAQNAQQIMSDKLRPFIFQAEKQISDQLKLTIEEQFRIKDTAVKATLTVDSARVAKNARLITSGQRYSLPGLDESVSIVEENMRNYEPKIQDVYYGLKSLAVSLTTPKELTPDEKRRIELSIAENLKSLQLTAISYDYKVLPPQEVPMAVAVPAAQTPVVNAEAPITWTNYIWPIIALIALFSGIGIIFYLITLRLGVNKLEKMTKDLAQAVSTIEIQMPSQQNERRADNNRESTAVSAPVKTLSLDEVKNQIKQLINREPAKKEELLKEFFSMSSAEKIFTLLDCIPENERSRYQAFMGIGEKEEYSNLLSRMASGELQEDKLLSEAVSLHREMTLYFHDPQLIKKQVVKNKIANLDRLSLAQLIRTSDAREFSILTQLASPIELSIVLSNYPQLLTQFDTLPKAILSQDDLSLFQKKVEAIASKQKHSYVEEINLSEYLPLDIEKDFNLKQGRKKTLWQELNDKQNQNLIDFALDLTSDELSHFMAILPQENQSQILERLPELKNLQLKRLGFKLNERSIELKHSFFQQLKQQTWQ